jgi:hypothetical protein
MRTVEFDPAKLTDPAQREWWNKWEARAHAATQKAIADWNEWLRNKPAGKKFTHSFSQEIWKDLKEWLLKNVFHFKCAYCESLLTLDRYKGDAEHFRPKGRVVFLAEKEGRKVPARCSYPDDSEDEHPGYFWLAYNWQNLVPACSYCNSGKGKVDQFPVQNRHVLAKVLSAEDRVRLKGRVFDCGDPVGACFLPVDELDAEEQPLILNPLNARGDREPSKHLKFGLGGKVVAVDNSPFGRHSIRCYQLDREELNRLRDEAQRKLHYIYYSARLDPDVDEAVIQSKIRRFREGEEPYSVAAVDLLNERLRQDALLAGRG